MTCEVCVRGGVTFQARGHPFGVSDALARLIFYPRDSFLQRVLSLEVTGSPEPSAVTGASEEPIVFPENYLEIEWQNPGVFSSFNLAAVVETTNDIVPVHGKVDFPIRGPVPEAYLSEGKIADQSRDIQQLAQELTADMDDLYRAVFALAQWCNKNIEYSLASQGKAVQPASKVLRNKAGKCDDVTALFISLSRAVGIPARFVHGYAYTNDKNLFVDPWGEHAWAEVLFPGVGWVPFDVTYGEYGYLTAGHVLLKVSEDANEPTIDYSAHGSEFVMHLAELDTTVEPLDLLPDFEADMPLLDTYLHPSHEEVGFGSVVAIIATLVNPQDFYVSTRLQFTKSDDTKLLRGDNITDVLLSPGEVTEMHFVVEVPTDLKSDFHYSFPFAISATFGGEAEVSVAVKKDAAMFHL